jgi:hypothetical protein
LSAFATEPLSNADFVVCPRKIAYNKTEKVQLFRDIVRGRSRIGAVAPDATPRNSQKPAEQLHAKHFRQSIPFELRSWRFLKREIQTFEAPFQIGSGIIGEFELDIPGDAGAVNVTNSFPERGQVEGFDALAGGQKSHGVGAAERRDRLQGDPRQRKRSSGGLNLDHFPDHNCIRFLSGN